MVRPDIGKGILNALLHTSGISGTTPSEEKAALVAKGVPSDGYPPAKLYAAFLANEMVEDSDMKQHAAEHRALVEESEHWTTANSTASFTYERTVNNQTVEYTKSFTGWVFEPRPTQNKAWPSKAYLALFTTMPDENGLNYVEPWTDEEGNETTYMRVDLHEAIISGKVCISNAEVDPVNGGSVIKNTEIFVYPEVYGPLWGTIVGIGIMPSETGGTPAHWARLTTPLTTQAERLPLFRMGGYETTLR